jgi:hypothetical protein
MKRHRSILGIGLVAVEDARAVAAERMSGSARLRRRGAEARGRERNVGETRER